MSRIGRKPIIVPSSVTIKQEGADLEVIGPKGNLKITIKPEIEAKLKDDKILLTRKKEEKPVRALHGLTRTLIFNMVEGVTKGYAKILKLKGTGYRVKLEGEKIVLSVGFSHPIMVEPPSGIKFEIEGNDTIKISGIDKGLVGQIAAKIRAIRPPEPYKGKGICYEKEQIRRKPGKAGKTGAAGLGVEK